jgi:hypothetical protein
MYSFKGKKLNTFSGNMAKLGTVTLPMIFLKKSLKMAKVFQKFSLA